MSDRKSPSGPITAAKGTLAIAATPVGTTATATATGSFVATDGHRAFVNNVVSLSPQTNPTASISVDGAAIVVATNVIMVRFVNVGASTSQAAITFDAVVARR